MAVLTSAEVVDQAEAAYIQGTYKIALTYNLTAYTDAVSLATVETDEINTGDGGYARLSYTYSSSDLATYKNGQPFTEKKLHNLSMMDLLRKLDSIMLFYSVT